MLAKSAVIGQFARTPDHKRDRKRLRKPEPFVSLFHANRVLREPQDLPCVVGVLPVNPLNGSRVCLASRLWSSQILCDSATEVS